MILRQPRFVAQHLASKRKRKKAKIGKSEKATSPIRSLAMAATLSLLLLAAPTAAASATCSAPTALGCFADPYTDPQGVSRRVLSHKVATAGDSGTMDVARCVALCCGAGYSSGDVAGVEAGSDCYCDHSFGPYTIPRSTNCTTPCTGDANQTCGGKGALEAFTVTCASSSSSPPSFLNNAPKTCGKSGCTRCPAEDLCCTGKAPDAYRVPGGYGCSPPRENVTGCASGGSGPTAGLPVGRCCCGPGPAASSITTSIPNVLVIGDSVSAGYTPILRAALQGAASVGHGPDNTGGGNADGSNYGALCTPYFVRTPAYELPPWDVITFNYGLHDGDSTNASYSTALASVADQLVEVAKTAKPDASAKTALIYFLTTHSDGGVVPGEPVTPGNRRVLELNAIATEIMTQRNITTVDLFATMTACGDPCKSCAPHCGPAGYQYLVDHAIAPAIRSALAGSLL